MLQLCAYLSFFADTYAPPSWYLMPDCGSHSRQATFLCQMKHAIWRVSIASVLSSLYEVQRLRDTPLLYDLIVSYSPSNLAQPVRVRKCIPSYIYKHVISYINNCLFTFIALHLIRNCAKPSSGNSEQLLGRQRTETGNDSFRKCQLSRIPQCEGLWS